MLKNEDGAEELTQQGQHAETTDHRSGVLIVDDHKILRQGLTRLINQEKDLFVCGEADNAQQGLDAIEALKPDVILVDISLPGMNGIEFIKNVKARHPDVPMVVLSMHDESLYAERALRAGALGYIMKKTCCEDLLEALRKARHGEFHVSGKIGVTMFQKFLGHQILKNSSPVSILSDRELEVFELIGRGKGTREIAESLHLSIKTIDSHRAHIKEKLKLSTATELIQHAVRFVERAAVA